MQKLLLFLCFLLPVQAVAQTKLSGAEGCSAAKKTAFVRNIKNARQVVYAGDTSIDVTYYRLNLRITDSPQQLVGGVQVNFTTLKETNSFFLDLTSNLLTDSVINKLDGKRLSFTHQANKLNVQLGKSYAKAAAIQIEVFYHGNPHTPNAYSFKFDKHGPNNTPVIWTLSEPYGSPDWWPCKDNPADKADSVHLNVTMADNFVVASNGKLVGKTSANGWTTHRWQSNYPIAHYLVSLAATDYVLYEQYYKRSATDSLLISHYNYPEKFGTQRKSQLNATLPIMALLEGKYGRYPFSDEKYGHAEFGFGGGMEHQTCSSMGAFSEGLITHELAHQWFGDKVTCKTWSDIWVNEGFATYSEILWEESKGNYLPTVNNYMSSAKRARGSIYVQNPSNEDEIFNFSRTYAKGAIVLHMLRGVLGDAVFYQTLTTYLGKFAYKAAAIRDFQAVAEQVSGQSLQWFFQPWLYGSGYPAYTYEWQSTDKQLQLKITQKNGLSGSTDLFEMPVRLQLKLANGRDTTATIRVKDATTQLLLPVTATVSSVAFDPQQWIMKDVAEVKTSVVLGNKILEEASLMAFPNPTNHFLTVPLLRQFPDASLQIMDTSGRLLFAPTSHIDMVDVSHLSTGTYWLRLSTPSATWVQPFIKN